MPNGDVPYPPPATPPAIPENVKDLYGHCLGGYQYRDILIPQQFSFMTQAFFMLVTVMGAVRLVDDKLGGWVTRSLIVVVGLVGFVVLVAYLFDMNANASCKGRLRWMMHWLERGVLTTTRNSSQNNPTNQAGYWHFIDQRRRTWFERWMRGIHWFCGLYWINRNPRQRNWAERLLRRIYSFFALHWVFRHTLHDLPVTNFFLRAGLGYVLMWPIITGLLFFA